tara:strand:+ start:355 stop:1125 length:771 start_codon:yes stop_codon:yes gene_type:complete
LSKIKNNIDWMFAEVCANICEYAYEDIATVEKYLKEENFKFKKIKFFEVDNAQGYGISFQTYSMLAFRGTEPTSFKDILADIKAWPADSETEGNVHAGFKGEVDKLWPSVTKWIKNKAKSHKLVITGHSLGAAMATIITSRLVEEGFTNVVLYTYGSPRVGDREWGKQFDNIEAYRFVNNNDIVCQVPPFGYYSHVGKLYYMTYDMKIKTNMTWWQRFFDKGRGTVKAWSKFQLFDGLYDHLGTKYIKRIVGRINQ